MGPFYAGAVTASSGEGASAEQNSLAADLGIRADAVKAGAPAPDETPKSETTPSGAGSRRRWVRASIDRVPTRWAGTILIAGFLAVTALFGGLAEVPPPAAPPEVGLNEQVTTATLEMTVTRAFIADRVEGGTSIGPDDHARILAVELEVTNLFDSYRIVRSELEGLGTTRIVDGPDETADLSRPGETANWALIMQPGITERFILTWAVDADRYRADDELRISLANPESERWQFLDDDLHWVDGGVSAYVTATLEDLGEGDPQ